ncbi:Proteasome activator subunit 4 (Proteasome activator PA200) [Durusdinium trenchii]|uniref:Proteasome activator subunit 4 (Proteasome activator PA200) n=1 Tax=Durusdinium trenchii TaxID=1381693 RepID=A0ABP0IL30_9DINO
MGEHVVVRGVPERAESAKREAVDAAVEMMEAAVQSGDRKLFARASKKLSVFLELKGTLGLELRGKLVNLCLDMLKVDGATVNEEIKVLQTLKALLSKRRVGLEKHVRLNWKDLLELIRRTHWDRSITTDVASAMVVKDHGKVLGEVCHVARRYYGAEAVEEICAEAETFMEDPLSRDLFTGQMILALFLPSTRSATYNEKMPVWVFKYWPMVEQCADWDTVWLCLVRRAFKWGKDVAGMVDSELMAELFRRVQFSLRLASPSGFAVPARTSRPGYLSAFAPKTPGFEYAAKIAIHLLATGTASEYYSTTALEQMGAADLLTKNSSEELAASLEEDSELSGGFLQLRRLLCAIQTLFHPSNAGRYTSNIGSFTEVLCRSFVKRLGRERVSATGATLERVDKQGFVDTMLPLLAMGMYSRVQAMTHYAQCAIGHLAYVAPIKVYNHFLPLIEEALDPTNLNQTHQAPAAIKMLTILIQPLLQARPLLAEALPDLLDLTLPGLDTNDVSKTMATSMLYLTVLSWVPIVDVDAEGLAYPSKMAFRSDEMSLSESYGIDDPAEEAADQAPLRDAMWRGSPVLVEWSLGCVDRLLLFIDNQVQRAKGGMAAQLDNAVFSSISIVGRLLLSQMSPSVRKRAGTKINEWALSSVNLDALREAKALIRSYAASFVGGQDEAQTKEVVFRGLFEPALARVVHKDSSARKLEWSLMVVGAIARVGGAFLLDYEDDLQAAIKVALGHEEASVRKLGGKLLRRTMRGLSEHYVASRASTSLFKDDTDKAGWAQAAVSWGEPEAWTTTCGAMQWHEPSKKEKAMAERLRKRYLSEALENLKAGMEASENSAFFKLHLELLFQVIRGSVRMMTSRADRHDLLRRCANVLTWLLDNRESDTVAHRRVIKSIGVLTSTFGAGTASHQRFGARKRWYSYMRETMMSQAFAAEVRARCTSDLVEDRADWVVPRYHQVEDVHRLAQLQLHQQGFDAAQDDKDAKAEDVLEVVFKALVRANGHDWTDTRKAAFDVLKVQLTRSPWFGKAHVDVFIDAMGEKKSHGRVLGATSMLSWRKIVRWIMSDWFLLDDFARTLLFETSATEMEDDKQKAVTASLQSLTVVALQAWATLPTDAKTEPVRASLMREITFQAKGELSWRQEIVVCALLVVMVRRGEDDTVDGDLATWVTQRCTSDLLPLRVVAQSVLVQLLAAASDRSLVKQLTLDTAFFRALVDTLAQNHSIANVSVDGNAKGMKQKSDWSAGVGDLLNLVRFPGSRFHPRTIVASHSKNFSMTNKVMIECLCRVIGDEKAAVAPFCEQLEYLLFEGVGTAEHTSRVCAAAEIFSGVGSVFGFNSELVEIVAKAFDDASLELADIWMDGFRLLSQAHLDFFTMFAEKLPKSLSSQRDVSQSVTAANLLRVLRVLVYEVTNFEARDFAGACEAVISSIVPHVGHSYETVRRESGRAFAAIVEVCKAREMESPWAAEAAAEMIRTVQAAPRDKESSKGTRAYETALHITASLIMVGGAAQDEHLVSFLPLVLEAQGHPNMDVGSKGKQTAGCVAGVSFLSRDRAFETLQVLCEMVSQSDNWYLRATVVQLFGAFFTLNFCKLGYAICGVHTRKEIEKLLRDPQVEVQNAASQALTQVLSSYTEHASSLETTRDRYLKLTNTKVKRDQFKTEEGKEKLKKRSTGALGLSALVNAFPYTVPFPSAVVALARRVDDPNPVGATAKSAILNFKRTHADSWEKHKLKFSSDELEDLQGSSFSGSHA